ncbi:type II toxin-antitoxin system RelE/ParE family toxin [Sandaracinobacter sp. RS1-74]|uniref:type II toxin-antitoxin system RelE/ParE family toxin n=1 Tax=Sandaracinobacteroides sayramensis TaxID=2913411 RepID=UPI001EDA31A7|nr:type II toxin-antitoxin system RelE/ParE family toxin [Sandaracinobacteroides sayramensis]MCG2841239.1 type II toxin-antitoxin system RelE/ParE family toxin [Sandaracinobacteroides sayramensis]
MIVHLSAEAEGDIEAIGDFIARDNPARAITFIQELRAKCLGLADLPRGYPLVQRYEDKGVRRCGHGNYLIFYRIEAERVVVLHVLHGAQDYTAILFPS